MNDWELEEFTTFFATLYEHDILRGVSDKMVWLESKDASFSVKSFYGSLACVCSHLFPWRGVWKSKVPTTVAHFLCGR